MNIKEAKKEIMDTVKAYTLKDDTGEYVIPVEKQRPMLLIGPPGIGKTAIMQQVANECHIGLVSYTITHHTRQSAIGLPFISKKIYGGREYSVTEYTMSEIIASVYDEIEKTGVKEGILFLDEINCVSETLAPTMLQFLQYKTFGSHRVPDGYIIVTAGNPPQYNKSVRDFDIVTLDRVRKITIEENFPVWKEYAFRMSVHGAILAYLEIHRENFYSIRTEVEEKYFVTARGWEDLSKILYVYEKLSLPVTENLAVQYIQDPEIAKDFVTYYELYKKYRETWKVPDILEGRYAERALSVGTAPFDEKLSLIGLLVDSLNQEFRGYAEDLAVQEEIFEELKSIRSKAKESGEKSDGEGADILEILSKDRKRKAEELKQKTDAGMLTREEIRTGKRVIAALEELEKKISSDKGRDAAEDFAKAKSWFSEREEKRTAEAKATGEHLSNSFEFMARCFGEGQEMVIFLTELTGGYYSLKFVKECGNDAYYKYNRLLLLKDRQQELRGEVNRMLMEL